MSEIRKLSTILFADIEGYTSLMQKDEHRALRLLQNFKQILETLVSKHKGATRPGRRKRLIKVIRRDGWDTPWKALYGRGFIFLAACATLMIPF